jgi:neutral amino acid transport system ATP-binding protein
VADATAGGAIQVAPSEAADDRHRTILAISGLELRFGGVRALAGTDLEVRRGSITALIGPNGAGKTTLFNAITGFHRAERGAAYFDGQPVLGKPPYAIARLGMARTFQLTKTLAAMPVLDNMMLAAPEQPGERLANLILRPRGWRSREAEVRERALELLDTFSLSDQAAAYAGTLSGGQRKLLELARVLMLEPRLILLDEPMAGINPALAQRLLAHIHELRERRGVTFLFIEHDMEVVMGESDRVIVMSEGKVIAQGAPEQVSRDARVIDAYLGSAGDDAS